MKLQLHNMYIAILNISILFHCVINYLTFFLIFASSVLMTVNPLMTLSPAVSSSAVSFPPAVSSSAVSSPPAVSSSAVIASSEPA